MIPSQLLLSLEQVIGLVLRRISLKQRSMMLVVTSLCRWACWTGEEAQELLQVFLQALDSLECSRAPAAADRATSRVARPTASRKADDRWRRGLHCGQVEPRRASDNQRVISIEARNRRCIELGAEIASRFDEGLAGHSPCLQRSCVRPAVSPGRRLATNRSTLTFGPCNHRLCKSIG